MLLLNYHTYKSMNFLKHLATTMLILPTELKATFRSFLKSMNSKEETTTPKSNSTEMRSELMDLLNASMLAVLVEPS